MISFKILCWAIANEAQFQLWATGAVRRFATDFLVDGKGIPYPEEGN